MRALVLSVPLALVAGYAHAGPATPEGAAELTAVLQTYLGAKDGVVTVMPAGASYAAKIDFAPLIAKQSEATVTPIELNLTDNGDGTWAMKQDQAFAFKMLVPGQADIAVSIASLQSTGTFDESLKAFSTSSTSLRDLKLVEKVTDPNIGETNVTYDIASMRYEANATANTQSGVDMVASFASEGIAETFTIPTIAMPLQMTAANSTGTMKLEGLQTQAVYQLIAFFVANSNEAAIAAEQASLKAMIKDGMPLFTHMIVDSALNSVAITSPLGMFSASDMGVVVEANGLVDDGMLREAISVSGLKLPNGLAPDWATDLQVSDLALDFKLSRFNPAAGVAVLLDGIDLADPNKSPDEMALMQAFMPDGEVEVSLAPSHLTSPIAALKFEGKMNLGGPLPVGKATVTMTGMTAARQALAKAPPEIGMQAAPALGMAEGMAKQGEDGALVWDLEMTREGAVLVNGVDMSALGAN